MVVSGTCGTRYVENPGTPSYLENTVVIQNEPGIQEVRTTPSVRVLSGVPGDVGTGGRPAPSPSDVVSLPSFLCVFACTGCTVYICMGICPKFLLFILLRPPFLPMTAPSPQVWDTARGVRCVFEGAGGDSTQRVSAALSVAMLDQQVVSFAADSQASASLDIQVSRRLARCQTHENDHRRTLFFY